MNVGRSVRCFASLLALGACFVSSVSAQSAGGQISMQAVQAACSADAARLCSNVPTGGGRVIFCLKQHQDELSDGCRKAGGLPPRSKSSQTESSSPAAAHAPSGSGGNGLAESAQMPPRGTTPAAIGQPSKVAGETFVRRPMVDPAHANMTVATLRVPEKWTFDSKVEWHYDWIENPLVATVHAANPANSEAFFQYPFLRLESISVAPQYRQYVKSPQGVPGSRMATGAINMPLLLPIPAMTLFIKQARPGMNIKFVGTQNLPDLAKALSLSPFPNDHGIAVKISYELDGKAVDEAFFGVYYYTTVGNAAVAVGQMKGPANVVQQTNWGFRGLMSFRAPAGTLERRMPVFALIAKSYALNPEWVKVDKTINDQMMASFNQKLQQGYDQLRAAQAVMAQTMAQEKEFDKGIAKFDQNLRTSSFDDSWLRTTGGGGSGSGGGLSSTDQMSNLLRQQDTVEDPNSSTGRTQLSSAGDYHFTNGLGDYRTYSDPNMTPEKAGASGTWTPLTTVQ